MNIFVKKYFILSVLFVFLILPIHSLELSFETGAGIGGGEINEIIYKDSSLLSRLDWKDDIIPVFYFKAQAETINIFLRFNMDFAIPVKSGTMEDYDFLIPGTNASHYSNHDSYLDKDFSIGLDAGYKFTLGRWYLIPSLGFSYRNRKWIAQDGYLQYPSSGLWTGDEPKNHLTGHVISYEQAIWYSYATLEVVYNLNTYTGYNYGNILLCVSFFPYVWVETIDNHYLRNIQFYDSLRGGIGWNIDLSYTRYFYKKNFGYIFRSGGFILKKLTGTTASSSTGLMTDSLFIDSGYSSKTESFMARLTVGLIFKIPIEKNVTF